jgi:hypothetical protein
MLRTHSRREPEYSRDVITPARKWHRPSPARRAVLRGARPACESLEDRTLLSVFSDLEGALGNLSTMQTNLDKAVNAVQHIPFLDQAGHQLGNILNNSNNPLIISQGFLNDLTQALTTADGKNLDPNNPATDTTIQNAIIAANLPAVVPATVHVTSNTGQNGEFIELDLQLQRTLFQVSTPINLSFGLPGLPIDVKSTGKVLVNVAFNCELAFGYSTENGGTGFFWNGVKTPNSNDQLNIEATASLQNASLGATLGVLQVGLTDYNDKNDNSDPLRGPTKLDVTFHVAPFSNVNSIPAPTLSGDAHISLTAQGGFTDLNGNAVQPIAIPNVKSQMEFPSVSTNFRLNWSFSGGTAPAASDLSVSFNDVQVQLGTFLSSFVEPIVQVIQDVTAPLQPIISFLVSPVPGVSDFSRLLGFGDVTPMTIIGEAANYAVGPGAQPIVDLIGELLKAVNDIDKVGIQANGLSLDLGNFDLNGQDGSGQDQRTTLMNQQALFGNLNVPGSTDLGVDLSADNVSSAITSGIASVTNELQKSGAGQAVLSAVGDLQKVLQAVNNNGFSFDFPILDDPLKCVFPLLLGKDADLFSFTASLTVPKPPSGTDAFGGSYYGLSLSFPIDLSAGAYFRLAYDTYGIREFFNDISNKTFNAQDLLDGFYIDDSSNLTFQGTVGPALSLHANPFFSLTLKGGLETGSQGNDPFSITFDDPNMSTDGGKDRLTSLIKQSCFFDATGEIDAGITIEVQVGFTVFNQFVGVTHDFDLGHVTLFSGNKTCLGQGNVNLVLGEVVNGTLYLDLGGQAPNQWPAPGTSQQAQDVENYMKSLPKGTPETFVVKRHPGDTGVFSESVDVSAFGLTQTFQNVTSIVADATGVPYDQNITIDSGVGVQATLTGGPQTNTLEYYGSGNAILIAGNDTASQLAGGSGANTFHAGPGTDVLIGGPSAGGNSNVFFGGSGADQFIAGPLSNDVMSGGTGSDTFTAGGGHDQMKGGTADNTYNWSEGNGPLDVTGNGTSNHLAITGGKLGDTFAASSNGQGVSVQAPGGITVTGTQIDTLNLDGTGDGDVYTVNDLSGTTINNVNLNFHEAAASTGTADSASVYGAKVVDDQVVIMANDVPVPQTDANGQNVTVQGMITQVQLTAQGVTRRSGGAATYKVNLAIPKATDTLKVDTDTGNDTVQVDSTQPRGHVYVNTGAGDDQITVGDPYLGLDNFLGPLDVDAGSGHNQIIFDEHASYVHDTVTLTASQVIRSTATAPVTVTVQNPGIPPITETQVGYPFIINYKASGGGDFAPSSGSPGVIFKTTLGGTNLFIPETGTAAPTEVICNGSYIQLGNSPHSIDHIVVGYDGQGQTSFPRSAGTSTLNDLRSTLTVHGDTGWQTLPVSVLEVDDAGASASETYSLGLVTPSLGFLERTGVSLIDYDVMALTLNAGEHGNQVLVPGVATTTTAAINAGNGSNTILVGQAIRLINPPILLGYSLDDIHGPLTVTGGTGTNLMTVDDSFSSTHGYNLSATTLVRTGGPAIAPISFSRITTLTVNEPAVADTATVVSGTALGTSVLVNTGAGSDALTVKTLDQIHGALAFQWHNGAKTALVDDTGAAGNATYTVNLGSNSGTVSRTGARTVTFNYQGSPPDPLTNLSLAAGLAHTDTINVLSIAAGINVEITGGTTVNSIVVGDTNQNDPNPENLDVIQGPLALVGQGSTQLVFDDQKGPNSRTYVLDAASLQVSGSLPAIAFSKIGAISLNAAPAATVDVQGVASGTTVRLSLSGTGSTVNVGSSMNQLLGAIQGTVSVQGTGTDFVNINDQNGPGMSAYILTASSVADSYAVIQYANVKSVVLNGGKGPSQYFVKNVVATPAVTIHAQGIGNSLTGPNQNMNWTITGPDTGQLTSAFTFTDIGALFGGTGNDQFSFLSGGTLSGRVNGGGGVNTLDYSRDGGLAATVDLALLTATKTNGFASIRNLIGSSSSDTLIGPNATNTWSIIASNGGTVGSFSFSSVENLTGGTGLDMFVFSAGTAISGKINGGVAGNDWLDYAAYTTLVQVNLMANTATGVLGGIANIRNVRGGQGGVQLTGNAMGNILIGGAGPNTIVGGKGPSILIGGAGPDNVTGNSGNDILIAGHTTYDSSSLAHDLALQSILAEWQSGAPYTSRINLIKTGANPLVWGVTVLDNAITNANTLTGTGGQNWFFANLAHTKTNWGPPQQLN